MASPLVVRRSHGGALSDGLGSDGALSGVAGGAVASGFSRGGVRRAAGGSPARWLRRWRPGRSGPTRAVAALAARLRAGHPGELGRPAQLERGVDLGGDSPPEVADLWSATPSVSTAATNALPRICCATRAGSARPHDVGPFAGVGLPAGRAGQSITRSNRRARLGADGPFDDAVSASAATAAPGSTVPPARSARGGAGRLGIDPVHQPDADLGGHTDQRHG